MNVKITPIWIVIAALVGYIAWKEVRPNLAASPAVATDSTLVDLGQKYRTAFDAAGQAALDAAANSTATTGAGLTQAQRDALDAALVQAATPVINELTRRVGGQGTRTGGGGALGTGNTSIVVAEPMDQIRAFWRDVAAGYRKGAK